MLNKIAAIALALFCSAGASLAADWPQWQGPARDGISPESGLLQEWPAEGPPLAWRVDDLGGGYSAPAVAGGFIYGLSNRGSDEVVWCLNEKDGTEKWVAKLGPAEEGGGGQGKEGPGCTPTVEGEHIYVIGAGGAVVCLQTSDGKEVWKRSLKEDFGGVLPMWRYSESPLVDSDKVICTPGSATALIVALNKTSGETVWTTAPPAPEEPKAEEPKAEEENNEGDRGRGRGRRGRGGAGSGAGYSSAIAIDFNGQRQYVQFTAKAVVGVSATDGRLLWEYKRPANQMGINCSTPIYQDGLIFAASAYGSGGGLAKLNTDASGNVTAEQVWDTTKMQNHHGGMIVVDGALYGAAGGNGGGFLRAMDFKSGDDLWAEREAPKGSLSMGDGRLYLYSEEGTIVLIEPNRDKYIERGRFEQPDRTDSPAWTHPVIANGKLYIRDQGLLLCYDVKAK